MARAYHPEPDDCDDYESIRRNGMWYQEWQGGYHDILKRGYPRPRYKTTILAELYSPSISDFLHGGAGDVPFLVSAKARTALRRHRLTGMQFSRVEIAKIAAGNRKPKANKTEPEDQILKSKRRMPEEQLPVLYAVRVLGRVEVVPEDPSGYFEGSRYISPFRLPRNGKPPDLWRPMYKGQKFSAWTFCSLRFKQLAEHHSLTNVRFVEFDEHMTQLEKQLRDDLRQES